MAGNERTDTFLPFWLFFTRWRVGFRQWLALRSRAIALTKRDCDIRESTQIRSGGLIFSLCYENTLLSLHLYIFFNFFLLFSFYSGTKSPKLLPRKDFGDLAF